MDCNEYRRRGKEMVDYIADYLENIRDRRVFPDVKPGYMRQLLPEDAPLEGEQWDNIFADIERVIMPGVTHWQSPHMHGYFPALNSFPSLLGDMLADAINCIGFTWASSPACTELEIIVMNWLGKMIGLPDEFLHLHNGSKGGGVIQTTASEATLVCLLAGRTRAIQRFHEKHPGFQDAEINARLVAYCSDQAHSSVEKAALIGLVRMRYIETDVDLSMRGQPLREAIDDDIKQGLVPFWVCATLGTTGACAFDNLEEVGNVCREYNLWLHIDSAYAGSAFICPEFRTWLKGIQNGDSIAFNPSKWLMVHFDLTALWIKDSTAVHRTFNVEPLYLQHENSGVAVDFMHWQIPLSRRFRALKLWFVLRSYGIKGLQRHIREGVRLAQKFEALVCADHRFEIPAERHLGLVVFRIKGDNEITERLLKRLNHRGRLHCVPALLKGKYVIRFTVTSTHTTTDDILRDWSEIKNVATAVLEEMNIVIMNRNKVCLKDTKDRNEAFGSSLLLSNCPLSPKIVNGSFAAIFDADEFLSKSYAGIRIAHQESPSMRRRVRGILMSGKQFSLDSHMDVVVQTTLDSNSTNSTTTVINTCNKNAVSNRKTKENNPHPIHEDNEESNEDCETPPTPSPVSNYIPLKNQTSTPTPTEPHTSLDDLNFKLAEVNTSTECVNSIQTPVVSTWRSYEPMPILVPKQTTESTTYNSDNQIDHTVYHGKRFLEPVASLLDNSVLKMLHPEEVIYNTSAKAMFSDDLRSPSATEMDWRAILGNLKTVSRSQYTASSNDSMDDSFKTSSFNKTKLTDSGDHAKGFEDDFKINQSGFKTSMDEKCGMNFTAFNKANCSKNIKDSFTIATDDLKSSTDQSNLSKHLEDGFKIASNDMTTHLGSMDSQEKVKKVFTIGTESSESSTEHSDFSMFIKDGFEIAPQRATNQRDSIDFCKEINDSFSITANNSKSTIDQSNLPKQLEDGFKITPKRLTTHLDSLDIEKSSKIAADSFKSTTDQSDFMKHLEDNLKTAPNNMTPHLSAAESKVELKKVLTIATDSLKSSAGQSDFMKCIEDGYKIAPTSMSSHTLPKDFNKSTEDDFKTSNLTTPTDPADCMKAINIPSLHRIIGATSTQSSQSLSRSIESTNSHGNPFGSTSSSSSIESTY